VEQIALGYYSFLLADEALRVDVSWEPRYLQKEKAFSAFRGRNQKRRRRQVVGGK